MDRLTQLNSQLTSGVNWAESARATLSKADGSAQQADGGEDSFSPMEGVEEGSRQLQGQDGREGTEAGAAVALTVFLEGCLSQRGLLLLAAWVAALSRRLARLRRLRQRWRLR